MSAFAASYAGSGNDGHDSAGTNSLLHHHHHHHLHHHHHHHPQQEPTAEEYEKLTWWRKLQYRWNCCLINWLVHWLCKPGKSTWRGFNSFACLRPISPHSTSLALHLSTHVDVSGMIRDSVLWFKNLHTLGQNHTTWTDTSLF